MDENLLRVAGTLTRRSFLGVIAMGGAVLVAPPCELLPQVGRTGGHRTQVVSFHMDQPYLDMTGTAIPYYPPPGLRSADVVASLSEDAFRSILL